VDTVYIKQNKSVLAVSIANVCSSLCSDLLLSV